MASHRSNSPTRSLFLLVGAGGVAAWAAFSPASPSPARALEAPRASTAAPEGAAEPAEWAVAALGEDAAPGSEEAGAVITGDVVEQLDVAKYSYLRLTRNSGETWVAVPLTSSRVGTRVTVTSAQLMTQFASATLARTFDEIYFGVLGAAPGPEATEHPPADLGSAMGGVDPHSPQQAPHPGPGRSADSIPVSATEKAPGPLGHTVAELHQVGSGAAGSTARVRGTVVKVTTGVMGRTFIHLRDGTGASPLTNDLTVTTAEEPAVGSQVVLEGTIRVNEDFGSGYRYSVLLADARSVTP